MLIENFSQYPARRLEIQSALQFLMVHTWTRHKSNKDIDQSLDYSVYLVVISNNLNGAQYDKNNYSDRRIRRKIKWPRSGRLCGLLAH